MMLYSQAVDIKFGQRTIKVAYTAILRSCIIKTCQKILLMHLIDRVIGNSIVCDEVVLLLS